jgi:urease accessory protein UreF
MALTLARGRRLDKFGRLCAEFDDVAAEDAVALAHAVAAGLRQGLADESENSLIDAAQAVLTRHDEGRRLEATVAALARALDASGRGDDAMVATLAAEGDAALLAGLLARRAGIDPDDAWRMFTGGEAMMLARLAGCGRDAAAQILAAFEPMSGAHSAERFIDRFDGIDDAAVEERRRWMRLDPHYRAAREAFGPANG